MMPISRTTLLASVAVALSNIDMGMAGSVRAAMMLGNMLPQESPGFTSTSRQLRPGKAGSKKRRGGPRKLHFRQKRKSRA